MFWITSKLFLIIQVLVTRAHHFNAIEIFDSKYSFFLVFFTAYESLRSKIICDISTSIILKKHLLVNSLQLFDLMSWKMKQGNTNCIFLTLCLAAFKKNDSTRRGGGGAKTPSSPKLLLWLLLGGFLYITPLGHK